MTTITADDPIRLLAETGTLAPDASWPVVRAALRELISANIHTAFTTSATTSTPITDNTTTTTNATTNSDPPSPTSPELPILATLDASFPHAPPFTIQRLAELALHPNQHYAPTARDKYIRALERVVDVESTVGEFAFGATGTTGAGSRMEEEMGTIGALAEEVSSSRRNSAEAILSPISWLVDTGTPPPETPFEEEDEDVQMEEVEDAANGHA
ncbi:uncharacterized protein V1518DRAFT_422120 [Limtongia smithiae]|uniref:uncharacterized protein n=1 Tax=Limtongia smithiae TaxID=1125753 RepID=UPI0034CD4D6B